jgi:nucleoside-diphosphate-sugar epimerase
MRKLIFGWGYLGSCVGQQWRDQGHEVHVVTRSSQKAELLREQGCEPLVADLVNRDSLAALSTLPPFDTVLFSVGWDRTAGQSQHEVYVTGLANVLSTLPEVNRFITISSTGVYGHCEGEQVDESTPATPLREGGKACLEAEKVLLASRSGSRSIILRLAGIYGPGRIPRAENIRRGLPIDAPEHGFLNLIHRDDAAHIVLLAEEKALLPSLYVVSDGHPVLRKEYYETLARLLHAPPPQFIPPADASPAGLRASSDKRIHPAKLFRELTPQLRHPTYQEGLAAIVAESDCG